MSRSKQKVTLKTLMASKTTSCISGHHPHAIRSCLEVATEWERRSGERLSRQRVQQILDVAEAKLRRILQGWPDIESVLRTT